LIGKLKCLDKGTGGLTSQNPRDKGGLEKGPYYGRVSHGDKLKCKRKVKALVRVHH
jgi:hypothetical protein